ncbi:hypothetical protein BurJ1DRAFT_1818 [Burkholderiales bacterium JOSHI_001]|nr:hypothetical protein BurJ1DRAFT_1818 [Burkholderiales bacterium JOSHI_001]
MVTLRASRKICALAVCAVGLSARATSLSNEEFASQVRTLRSQMSGNEAIVKDALTFCPFLPRHRAVEEPRCVALQGHLRAGAGRIKSAFPEASGQVYFFQG